MSGEAPLRRPSDGKKGRKEIMKHRTIVWLAACALTCALLAGCGHEHTWTEATCTEPKTCSECGKTEGEALGHDWAEATCAAPMTCTRCGATEGEALEHTATKATYQSSAVCTVCGAEVGDPLTPAFEAEGVKGTFMEVGRPYPYRTLCYDNPSEETICTVTVTNTETFASDETHEAKDGYEWKIVELEVLIDDRNGYTYGYQVEQCNEDYYDIQLLDETLAEIAPPAEGYDSQYTFSVNWNGEEYECMYNYIDDSTGWRDDGTTLLTKRFEYLVPAGYDGCVIGFYNAATEWGDGQDMI